MVSTISPYSYLAQLQGTLGKAATPAATSAPTTSSSSNATTGASTIAKTASSNNASAVSSLLNNGNAFTPEVLSLLQQDSNGSFNPVTTLLNGPSTNDGVAKQYSDLFSTSLSAQLTQTKSDATSQQNANPQQSQVQNLINAFTNATTAYNKTNQQNAQTVINANSYGADGVTKLVG